MKVYKLKHKKSGLFFTPSKGNGNLSTSGKIYTKMPKLEWCEQIRIVIYKKENYSKKDKLIIEHFDINIDEVKWMIDKHILVNKQEWEIIEL